MGSAYVGGDEAGGGGRVRGSCGGVRADQSKLGGKSNPPASSGIKAGVGSKPNKLRLKLKLRGEHPSVGHGGLSSVNVNNYLYQIAVVEGKKNHIPSVCTGSVGATPGVSEISISSLAVIATWRSVMDLTLPQELAEMIRVIAGLCDLVLVERVDLVKHLVAGIEKDTGDSGSSNFIDDILVKPHCAAYQLMCHPSQSAHEFGLFLPHAVIQPNGRAQVPLHAPPAVPSVKTELCADRQQAMVKIPNLAITISGGKKELVIYLPFTAQTSSNWHKAQCETMGSDVREEVNKTTLGLYSFCIFMDCVWSAKHVKKGGLPPGRRPLVTLDPVPRYQYCLSLDKMPEQYP
ncbi:hypothetical protein B0H10DRAFT_1955018 [Mycena sp. CBHHK59/15]|nr:hypothetical protein B0H10DRAFT_1955018 [Mycena sp. CBHHK59/15]